MAASGSSIGRVSGTFHPRMDWDADPFIAYLRNAPMTFHKIVTNWIASNRTGSLRGTEFEPKPRDSEKQLDETDIFDACQRAPGAIHWCFFGKKSFYLCLKLVEETSKELYTLRFIDDNRKFSSIPNSHGNYRMELWDAKGKRCDQGPAGMVFYDYEMSAILDLDKLGQYFYAPENGKDSFSLAI